MALPYPGCAGACSPISSTIGLKKATVDVFTHLKSASAAVGAPPPRAGCSRWLAHLCSWPQRRGTGAPCGHLHRASVRMASPEGQEEAALSPSSKAACSLNIQSTLPLLESFWPVLKTPPGIYTLVGWASSGPFSRSSFPGGERERAGVTWLPAKGKEAPT